MLFYYLNLIFEFVKSLILVFGEGFYADSTLLFLYLVAMFFFFEEGQTRMLPVHFLLPKSVGEIVVI